VVKLKDSNPGELAEYAITNQTDEETMRVNGNSKA
jgi:hypothetical protein